MNARAAVLLLHLWLLRYHISPLEHRKCSSADAVLAAHSRQVPHLTTSQSHRKNASKVWFIVQCAPRQSQKLFLHVMSDHVGLYTRACIGYFEILILLRRRRVCAKQARLKSNFNQSYTLLARLYFRSSFAFFAVQHGAVHSGPRRLNPPNANSHQSTCLNRSPHNPWTTSL